MAVVNYSATLDGSTSFTHLNGNTVDWDPSGFLGYLSFYHPTPGDTLDATVTLDGMDWTIAALRFGADGDNITRLSDANGNSGRRIDFLSLGDNSDVDLISTRVKYIEGNDGDLHDVTLGSANTGSVNLYANQNWVTTGSGWVGQIETSGKDRVTVDSGGAGFINTGDQRDIIKVQNGGSVDLINAGSGNDLVTIVGGSWVGSVRGTDGNNTVTVGNNSTISSLELNRGSNTVNLVGSGRIHHTKVTEGDATINTDTGWSEGITSWMSSNMVNIGTGGVGSMLFSGDATLVHNITSQGWIGALQVSGDAQTTVTLQGSNGAATLRTSGGDDMITTDTGWVELISTRDGNDVVELGTGGAGTIRLGGGDDVIKISDIDPNNGVAIFGQGGSDTIDFSAYSLGITFTLDSSGIWQKPGAPGGDLDLPGGAFFQETGVDNITGTSLDDWIEGDRGDNVLSGGAGKDEIRGLGGADEIDGGISGDRLFGQGGADTISGGGGNDKIIGGGGGDRIEGGTGKDKMTGNSGADTFVFGANSGADTITDYDDGVDSFEIADHAGGFGTLVINDDGTDIMITHDGGTITLDGATGTTIDAGDFNFLV
jgi:Ca2+-binding RTX toxin-like protein